MYRRFLAFAILWQTIAAAPSAKTLLLALGNGNAAVTDADGNTYITGTARADMPFGTAGAFQPSPPEGSRGPSFVAKLSPQGNLLFATYLSGSTFEEARAIAIDADRNVYVAGRTASKDFPTTPGAYQRTPDADIVNTYDGFVAKISSDGSRLIYSTFIGGNAYDSIEAIAVDSQGRAYIAGSTGSSNFPVRGSLAQTNTGTAFVARLSADGSAIDYSVRFGGSGPISEVRALALNPAGGLYLGGFTNSIDFPLVNAVASPPNVTFFKSDTGADWTSDPSVGLVYSLAIDPSKPTTRYLGIAGGVLKSTDGGATWTPKYFPGSGSTGTTWIDVNPWNSNLLVAVGPGTFASKDGGETWTQLFGSAPSHVLQLSADGQVLVVDGGRGRSTDGGKTFQPIGDASPNQVIAARDKTATDAFFMVETQGSNPGFYRVSAGGTKVDRLATGSFYGLAGLVQDPITPTTLYAAVLGIVNRSLDSGKTWATFSQTFPATTQALGISSDGSQLLVATGTSLYRYSGSGTDWSEIVNQPANPGITSLVNVPGTTKWMAVAAPSFSGLNDGFLSALSADGSAWTFSSRIGGAGDDFVFALAAADKGQVYVAGLTKSRNLAVSATAQQKRLLAFSNGFIGAVDTKAGAITALSYVGGSASFSAQSVAIDGTGRVLVAGSGGGTGFPLTDSLIDNAGGSISNAPSVVILDSGLTSIQFASYLGLTGSVRSFGFQPAGQIVLSGSAAPLSSVAFPVEQGYPSVYGGTASMVSVLDLQGASSSDLRLNPITIRAGALTSTGTISISTGQPWTAASSASWLKITGAASGTGSGQISFSVDATDSAIARSAYVSVNNRTVVVTQDGNGQIVSINPQPTALVSGAGTTLSFQVTASASNFTWTARTESDWVTISAGASGVGNGTLTLQIAPNPNSLFRAAVIYVGKYSFTITQDRKPLPPSALRFVPLSPCRVADTRAAGASRMSADSTRDFLIAGNCGVPANAMAYSLNVTVVPQGPLGFLSIWPAGVGRPLVSTLNSDGRVKANAAIVPAGTNGSVSIYVTDATDVVLDLNGYFVPDTGLAFYPITPCRIADTRNSQPIPASNSRDFAVAGVACGVPAAAKALSLNVTAVPQTQLSYLTMWPAGSAQPFASTLNSYSGAIVANAAIIPVGTGGAVSVYVTHRSDVVLDVNGYFAPAGAGGLYFYPLAPCRMSDTRVTGGRMAAGETRTVSLASSASCDKPSGVSALSVNATVVPQTYLQYLTLGQGNQPLPFVSTLNSFDGAITSNAAIVPSAAVAAYVSDAADVILDANGYFAP